jgi:colanic acid/amylovoran biosynthesis glycosyltransferase
MWSRLESELGTSARARHEPPVIALQRTSEFVGRTMNWLYDHLRFLPRYTPMIRCDTLANRQEFPELDAQVIDPQSVGRRIWSRLGGRRLYPPDRIRLQRIAPRLLHSHFGYVAVADMQLAEALNVPWVASFYGADIYQLGRADEWREPYAALFRRVTKVLALGPAMAATLETLGCPRDKVAIHPLGIDVEGLPFAPRTLHAGEALHLLFAGTFREKKGIEYVVQGAARARQSGVRLELHLVGSPMGKPGDQETERSVASLIRELGIVDCVIRHGFLPFNQLIELALRSHVFVAPSVTATDGDAEGTPFVLQQMMATGMPVIATEHSDIPFLLGNLRGMLVPERDASAIADRIQRFWKDPAALVTEGELLRRRMREHFHIRQCAGRLAQFYDELLV